jgi:hypothetical protein
MVQLHQFEKSTDVACLAISNQRAKLDRKGREGSQRKVMAQDSLNAMELLCC